MKGFGAPWGPLGPLGALWGPLGPLGPPWAPLGALWGPMLPRGAASPRPLVRVVCLPVCLYNLSPWRQSRGRPVLEHAAGLKLCRKYAQLKYKTIFGSISDNMCSRLCSGERRVKDIGISLKDVVKDVKRAGFHLKDVDLEFKIINY